MDEVEPYDGYMHPEPLTPRWFDVKGFEVHRTAYFVTNTMALSAWVVLGPVLHQLHGAPFFPAIPLLIWTPLLIIHAVSTWARRPSRLH